MNAKPSSPQHAPQYEVFDPALSAKFEPLTRDELHRRVQGLDEMKSNLDHLWGDYGEPPLSREVMDELNDSITWTAPDNPEHEGLIPLGMGQMYERDWEAYNAAHQSLVNDAMLRGVLFGGEKAQVGPDGRLVNKSDQWGIFNLRW